MKYWRSSNRRHAVFSESTRDAATWKMLFPSESATKNFVLSAATTSDRDTNDDNNCSQESPAKILHYSTELGREGGCPHVDSSPTTEQWRGVELSWESGMRLNSGKWHFRPSILMLVRPRYPFLFPPIHCLISSASERPQNLPKDELQVRDFLVAHLI